VLLAERRSNQENLHTLPWREETKYESLRGGVERERCVASVTREKERGV